LLYLFACLNLSIAAANNSFDLAFSSTDILAECEEPSDFTVGNVTETTAQLSWEAQGNTDHWQIAYGPAGYDDPATEAELMEVYDLTDIVLEGLTQNVNYDVYIHSICDDEISSWIGSLNFTTKQGACEPPIDLEVSAVTENSATISWYPGGDITH